MSKMQNTKKQASRKALATTPRAKEPKAKKAAPAPTPASPTDPRLPPAATVLQKKDRHGTVRCECTVQEDGIHYDGNLYRSISSAALAAAKDLGLKNKTQNGYVFWGLEKPARPATDPMATLERAWVRYRDRAEAATKDGLEEDVRKRVAAALVKHAQTVEKLAGSLK